ncbi:MAG TPA: glycogen/starch/alpha-glucan phosphorylase, partial [Candidatus Polarisedimenticolia bacterium]|nr:glycogen/starch/alpha-glucan phosphorylase [Candidatus Polarisedimenticolia bacterium]
AEDVRTGLSAETLHRALLDNLCFLQGKLPEAATRNDWYLALAYTVRDRLLQRWIRTLPILQEKGVKVVGYLSAEFLLGPQLGNNLIHLGILQEARQAVERAGQDLDVLLEHEEEPGLGNGGLGRLAACFLDSLASLQLPAIGYGIRYEFGSFTQKIVDGWQAEAPDNWLRSGNPWEIARPEITYRVGLAGHTESYTDLKGRYRVRWSPGRIVQGVAHDTPIPGYRAPITGLMRLWKAEASESFDFRAFNLGDYVGAVHAKVLSENITKVLYPNDDSLQGKQLRLEQQYFFVACSLQDMIRMHLSAGGTLESFHEKFAVQLNDTHPAIAVAELMRLLVDEHGLEWTPAWSITRRTLAYTNHTLLPEALEKWPAFLLARLLPRHLEIVHEINRRFLDEVRIRFPDEEDRAGRLSLLEAGSEWRIRMAHLAALGSHAINGVAALHTELLESEVLRDFHDLAPERFHSITNGVSPRRFLLLSNPLLSELLTRHLGAEWPCRLEEMLPRLEPLAMDASFRMAWRRIKEENKRRLGTFVKERLGHVVDPTSLFDIHVKRLHEYKRQHLNLLHIITLYHRLKRGEAQDQPPRTFFFGGKAAPGYFMAKLIIRLIHGVADVVNTDPATRDRLRVVFVPDFNVKAGQRIYPAADLSEQISTAGKEASGTGNMKFALNGALTMGTLDGANIEIRAAVGEENFFSFGLTAGEGALLRAAGHHPRDLYDADPELRETLDSIARGDFSRGDLDLFRPLLESLLERDEFLLLADYRPYLEAQERAGRAFLDQEEWTRKSILNVARVGIFSSDRAIREYCEKIWRIRPVPDPDR